MTHLVFAWSMIAWLAASAAPTRDATPTAVASDSIVVRWQAAVAVAESALVYQVMSRTPVASDSAKARVVRREARVGRDWIRRFASLTDSCGGFQASCPGVAGSAKESPPIAIRFGAEAGALVSLSNDCLTLTGPSRERRSANFSAVRPRMIALIGAAFPSDTALARSAGTDRHPAAATGSSDDSPKYGEYVYVEELPEAISKVPPDYPDEARKSGTSGTVIVQALIGKDGAVKQAFASQSIRGLDAAAIQSVLQWRFKPARSDGKPVAVWVTIPVKFTLH